MKMMPWSLTNSSVFWDALCKKIWSQRLKLSIVIWILSYQFFRPQKCPIKAFWIGRGTVLELVSCRVNELYFDREGVVISLIQYQIASRVPRA